MTLAVAHQKQTVSVMGHTTHLRGKVRHYWQQNYLGQKALIQAHITLGQDLWGIIQVAQFSRPRPWTKFDRSIMFQIVDKIAPLVSVYARRKLRGTIQVLHDGDR